MPMPIGRSPAPIVPASVPGRPAEPTSVGQPPPAQGPTDNFSTGNRFVSSIAVFSSRQKVTLDAPLKMVGEVDANGAPSGWHAELDLPLDQLGLTDGTLAKLAIGEPWRNEKSNEEALPFTISNGRVHVTVPNVNASLETWGTKVRPAFAVVGSNGQRVLLEVQPKQVTRDTTAMNTVGLKQSVAAVQSMIDTLQGSANRLRAFLADPKRTDLAPESSFLNGKPAREYDAAQIAEAQAAMQKTDADLITSRAAAQSKLDCASPLDREAVLLSSLMRSSDPKARELSASIGTASQKLIALTQKVGSLEKNLEETKALLPRDQIAAREAELADAKAGASTAKTQIDAAAVEVVKLVGKDAVLTAADQVLGSGNLNGLISAKQSETETIALFQNVLANDLASATASATRSLPVIDAQLKDAQAELAAYKERLKSPAELDTTDLTPAP